jgi:hypothetical protein
MKRFWGGRVTTVFVRQGHYAMDENANANYQPSDISLDRIGDFVSLGLPSFTKSMTAAPGLG